MYFLSACHVVSMGFMITWFLSFFHAMLSPWVIPTCIAEWKTEDKMCNVRMSSIPFMSGGFADDLDHDAKGQSMGMETGAMKVVEGKH